MVFLSLFILGFVNTFILNNTNFHQNTLVKSYRKIEIPKESSNSTYRNFHRVYISKWSEFNGHPKRRKEYKRPPWYDLFDENVEKEPLGTPSRLLPKDVLDQKRRLRFTLKKTKNQMYATIFDDVTHNTLCHMSTNFKILSEILGTMPTKNPKISRNKGGTVKAAYELGKLIGRQALSKGISKVFFDRSGYRYHGRVEALAIGARKVGLDF